MKRIGSIIAAAAGLAMLAAWTGVQAQGDAGPVVLELFTSQGCSSCPPADAVAAKLAQRGDVIVISRPVTYWDRYGWKDTLARPANTQLQSAYAVRGLVGENGVFTPQAVVAGRTAAIGSHQRELEGLIAKTAAAGAPRIALAPDGAALVSANGYTGPLTGRLTLVGLDSSASVAVGSGENGHRRLTYTNIYQGETALGNWNGSRQRFVLPASARHIAGADRYVLLLREETSGPILAALQI